MKPKKFSMCALSAAVLSALAATLTCSAAALDGEPFIHDPSTVMQCDGKFFAYGTGGGGIISDDGWTWHSGNQLPARGAAPDLIRIGDHYIMAIGATGGGLNGGHSGRIGTQVNKSLDPQSPDFKWSEQSIVASSDGVEDCDAIDPSLMQGPDGKLWLSYGTFFGFVRLVELDPQTGKRVEGNQFVNIAIDCEGTDLGYNDGWYYLFGTHGTCCNGATSTYNIQVGRSKTVQGPYIDNMGQEMLKGGGKMVVAASGRFIGPGHFGRMVLAEGVEKFSCHYEADLDRGGSSVLEIRPLMWKDGWPVAGDNIQKETNYKISASGANLQTGAADWTVTPLTNAGGYPGMPYCKITAGGKALALDANKQVVTVPAFTDAPEQMWRLDQMTDGAWRIMPKTADGMALSGGASGATLAKYDFKSASQHWNFADPAPGNPVKEGTYEIQSARSGFALEIAVDGTPIGGGRGGRGGGGRGRGGAPGGAPGTAPAGPGAMGPSGNDELIPVAFGGGAPGGAPGGGGRGGAPGGAPGGGGRGGRGGGIFGGGGAPVAVPDVADVSKNWPTGNIELRLSDYMLAAHQKWAVSPVGTPGDFKIVIAGTTRALAATPDREVVTVPEYSGQPTQIWHIDLLADGTYRVAPKSVQGDIVLTSIGGSTPSLVKFDPNSDKSKWNFRAP